MQSTFHLAQSQEAAADVQKLMGKRLLAVSKSVTGCLLQFGGVADYLIVIGSKLPVFEEPKPTDLPGQVELKVKEMRDVVAVSVSGAGMLPDVNFWKLWADDNINRLLDMTLTGYSFQSLTVNGAKMDAAMFEFDVDYFLGVTAVTATMFKRNQLTRPS